MASPVTDIREISGSDLISALHLAQRAPAILGQESGSAAISSKSSDTADYYARLEQLMLVCLRTGDDQSAQTCLNRLSLRFGPSNERIMGLRGLYEEATAKDEPALEKCLQEYDNTLSQSPVNVPILKRRVALLRSLNRPSDAISGLIQLVDAIPTDAEAWCELADLYQSQGLGSQAIFSLEEALLIAPNSWNASTRILDNDYAGVSGQLSKKTLEQLKAFALLKLGEIVESRSVDDQHWASSRSELIAAKELLNRQ
ncbi:Tetratricopeptide-like helical [Penicillium vulpinum]|uniref:Tetratricopeptide-like helical n=1 Tax=Penicillium vulpinum TaxID=29845 RepID=UPI00254833DD|nr:Tetratricopeptide-like helical [Penicillium vulpinum]KAJ5971136.1 Tetratricopeptide-like helical [Penicillium vulpinum]